MGRRANGVMVITGIPGAGKSTLIRRAVDRSQVRVVDTDDHRRGGRQLPRALRILVHYLRIVRAVLGRRPAVIHSRGTTTTARRAIALLARLRGRPVHLVMIVASEREALAGQRARGRSVGAESTHRHARRFAGLAATDPEQLAIGEGWTTVRILSRAEAAAIDHLHPGPGMPRRAPRAVALRAIP